MQPLTLPTSVTLSVIDNAQVQTSEPTQVTDKYIQQYMLCPERSIYLQKATVYLNFAKK
jgi:hypothetical protein